MDTKQAILSLLEQSSQSLSGETIAQALGISRAAVWKHIKTLQKEGYAICAQNRNGYLLERRGDKISEARLQSLAGETFRFCYVPSLESSNTALKAIAQEKAEGYVLLAGEQTAGRGRLGRSFFSPGDTGIYLSLLLKPHFSAELSSSLTALAALSVCEALEEELGLVPKIKWVNDVCIAGKKVCGILTEASYNVENAELDYVIVGIGINVYAPQGEFPEELQSIAGALCDKPMYDLRNRLIAKLLLRFWAQYHALPDTSFVVGYKARSMVLGKSIWVHKGEEKRQALALDIDSQCRLLVEYENKEKELLHSGEVSIRL